jgi:ABC-type cobalamin/Fe3+-siderophores transport system ATPase subunit
VSKFPNDSVKLVPAQGGAKGFGKSHLEKWLIYCPAIASDTLLYMVTALESYSLRSYAGHLGVVTTGRHAEGATTTTEFMEMYEPVKIGEMSHAEVAVTKTDQWARIIGHRWDAYREANGIK